MKTRTNIKLVPDKKTQTKIKALLQKHKLPKDDFTSCPHCTIIYSLDIVDIDKISCDKLVLPIVVKDSHFELFDTKDDGIVLVIEFQNDDLIKLFKHIKTKYKLTTKYDDFRPHITIAKNISKKIILPKINFDLIFDKIEKDNG